MSSSEEIAREAEVVNKSTLRPSVPPPPRGKLVCIYGECRVLCDVQWGEGQDAVGVNRDGAPDPAA